jgi:glutamine amidotransferase-like uncharacterized protein
MKNQRKIAKRQILVLKDHGIDALPVVSALQETFKNASIVPQILMVTPNELLNARPAYNHRSIAGIVIPGAFDANYDQRLGANGQKEIRHYVMNGGRYLGFCAGAYYACKHIVWKEGDKNNEKVKILSNPLFNYKAAGPINELVHNPQLVTNPLENVLSHASLVDVDWRIGKETGAAKIMYWGGPDLTVIEDGFEKDPDHSFAKMNVAGKEFKAIVTREFEKGRVTLSSIHPEIKGNDFLRALSNGTSVHYQKARADGAILEKYEPQRKQLWDSLVKNKFPEFFKN